ncbi:MAG: hypothetical protein DWQ07_18855 [Chloroflexi bacterium]|nr:MAG: hypothetical protein DWQ07_18855 [Chloroflexota bacterium]MBL1194993.1 hypothetical protein [Chloroflexota bacterium]NOH12281.1 hypothetical protein [Chloroflexota bacterium]
MLHPSKQVRLWITVLVILAAIFMIAVQPFMINEVINPIVEGQLARMEKFAAEDTPEANVKVGLLGLTPWLVSFFFPFWTALSFVGGFVLLAIARPLYQGERWARATALLALAMPAMGGAYMIVPWMNFVGSVQGGFPPAVLIMMVGLVPYFAVLLAEKSALLAKVANFFVFLMLGVCAAENFANGHAAFRVLYGHPARPIIPESIAVLWLSWPVLWITSLFFIIAIYQLGKEHFSGYYLALIAGAATVVASYATHTVRNATNDYLYGALMGLSVVVLLLIPYVKRAIFSELPEEIEPQVVSQPAAAD